MSVKKILVAYDGSADSEKALDWACDMARQVDATVHAIFVLELYDYFALEDTFYRPLEGAYREVADQKFAQIQEKYKNSGISVTTHVQKGVPDVEVIRCAHDISADLIICGTRGLGGIARVLLGSIAHKLVTYSDIPVLVIK
ncbi:MAG: nhaX 1 [Firmicutes bacterium]|nr:nhaX 1 [Bacillota bacterium]